MGYTSNAKIGNATEQMYLEKIKEIGGWASLIPKTFLGQPVDTVAIYGDITIFADIKHCSKKTFSFNAIQHNQLTSMEMMTRASKSDKHVIGFWIWFEPIMELRWLSYKRYLELSKTKKSVRYDELKGWKL